MLDKVKTLLNQIGENQARIIYLNSLSDKYGYLCVDNSKLIADHTTEINLADLTEQELNELYIELNSQIKYHDTEELRREFSDHPNNASVKYSQVF